MKKGLAILLAIMILFVCSVTVNADIGELELLTLEGTYEVSLTITNPDVANKHIKQSYGLEGTIPEDIIERKFTVDIKYADGEYLLFSKGNELDNPGLSRNKDIFIFDFMYEVTDSSISNILYGVKANLRFNEDTQSFDIVEPQGKINLIYHNNGGYGYIGIGDFSMDKIAGSQPEEEEEEPEEEESEGVEPEEQIPRGITFVKGIVEIKRAGSDKWIRVRGSMPLNSGDIVRTGKNSYAYIGCGTSEFAAATGSEIQLRPLSVITVPDETLKVEKKSRVRVAVDDAVKKVYALFGKEEFEIETPSAVSGIRGTDFIVDVDEDGNTTFLLNEGSISVKSKFDNTETTLRPGQKILAPINSTLSDPGDMTSSDKKAFSNDTPEEETGSPGLFAIIIIILIAVVVLIVLFTLFTKRKRRNKIQSTNELEQKQAADNAGGYCSKCGKPLASSSKFCKNCGNKADA